MTEWRRHPRVKEAIDVRWSTGFLGIQGNGTIRNISLSGILLEVDDRFKPEEDGHYKLEVIASELSSIVPNEVKLVWFNRFKTDKLHKFCGMKFTHAEGSILTRLAHHIEHRRTVSYDAMDINIIQNYLSQSN